MSQYLFLLLVLACPLMMIFMMRGMQGSHGESADGGHEHGMSGCHSGRNHTNNTDAETSLDELRRQRDELDRRIEQREADEHAPVGSGWR
jgi:hypothetical protein